MMPGFVHVHSSSVFVRFTTCYEPLLVRDRVLVCVRTLECLVMGDSLQVLPM
jgi:hypothetical protein